MDSGSGSCGMCAGTPPANSADHFRNQCTGQAWHRPLCHEAFRTPKGTSGGVAILLRKSIGGRLVHYHSEQGCGFIAVAFRIKNHEFLLVSIYLKCGQGLQSLVNSSILSALLPLLQTWKGLWMVAGDWNVDSKIMQSTLIHEQVKGAWLCSGQPTMLEGPNELDYALVAQSVFPLSSVTLDWDGPHRPHATVMEVEVAGFQQLHPQLPSQKAQLAEEFQAYYNTGDQAV